MTLAVALTASPGAAARISARAKERPRAKVSGRGSLTIKDSSRTAVRELNRDSGLASLAMLQVQHPARSNALRVRMAPYIPITGEAQTGDTREMADFLYAMIGQLDTVPGRVPCSPAKTSGPPRPERAQSWRENRER